MRIAESELIINGDGSVFHLHLRPEELADNVIWLEDGQIKEEGEPQKVVDEFMATVPVPKKPEIPEFGEPEIVLEDVKKHYYSIERGVVKAVDGVDLTINKEEIFGIVGLSGSGKTTTRKTELKKRLSEMRF